MAWLTWGTRSVVRVSSSVLVVLAGVAEAGLVWSRESFEYMCAAPDSLCFGEYKAPISDDLLCAATDACGVSSGCNPSVLVLKGVACSACIGMLEKGASWTATDISVKICLCSPSSMLV